MNKRNPILMTYCLVLLVLFAMPFLAVAQTQTQEANVSLGVQPEYRIQVGDELEIKSFFNPEINDKVTVRPDGRISLQLVNDLVAVNKTPTELAQSLTQQYSAQFRQPEVSVILRTFSGQRVYVGGEVVKPQILTLVGPMTALQAISAAEGFRETAKTSEIFLIRRGADLRPQTSVLNLKSAINGNDPLQDTYLQPYDIIYVPKSGIANVNKFIDQVIRKNIPIPFSLSYRLNDPTPGGN